MSKNTYFTGQPIFSQLLNLIPKSIIFQTAKQCQSDYYTKKFDTYSHLITMLFVVFRQCTSLREVEMGMSICHNKLKHLGISYVPARSTLAEANIRRSSDVFAAIHSRLYQRLRSFLPDSRASKRNKKLYIIDSTTVSLFQEIMGTVGNKPVNGKRKGGYKVHTLIKADEDVPKFIKIGKAASSDKTFLKDIKLPKGSIITFDKGYATYKQYRRFTQEKVWMVTRAHENAIWTVEKQRIITDYHKKMGVISDTDVILGHTAHKQVERVAGRIIIYYDKESDRSFTFFTNNKHFSPVTIAQIYQKRWQIEILFKRIKHNFPLRYFLGDNPNAIHIQTWCVLIADLIVKVIKAGIKRKWSFTGVVSLIRQNLLEYIDIKLYLSNPDKVIRQFRDKKINSPPTLFSIVNMNRGLEIQF